MFRKLILSLLLVLSMTTPVLASSGYALEINSVDSDKNPVVGFIYELENKETKEKVTIDLTKESKVVVEDLAKGKYIVRQIKRPDKYQETPEREIETKGGKVVYEPKLILKTVKEKEKYTKTGSAIPLTTSILGGALIGAGVAVVYNAIDTKKKQRG